MRLTVCVSLLLSISSVAWAEFRNEDPAKMRIVATPELAAKYPVRPGLRVNDAGGGVIIAQSDSILFGYWNEREKPIGWFSYQTRDGAPFNYESARDSLGMLTDFRGGKMTDKTDLGPMQTAFGAVDVVQFKLSYDSWERFCAVWRGYANGNRTVLAGYLCTPIGDQMAPEQVTEVLSGVVGR